MKLFKLLDIQYNKFTSEIKNYLSKTLSGYGVSYSNSTIFGQIINVFSSVVQNVMLYIEDAFTEQNVYTAQRKKSIYSLAALSGYRPSLGKSSGVQLKFSYTPSNVSNFNLILNNHEQLTCTQNGMIYNVILPQNFIVLSLEKDNSSKYIYAVQGRFETQTFISDGGKYWTTNLQYTGNIDTDYLEVRVNDEPWEMCDCLYDMNPDGKQFTWNVGFAGGINLIFGNGIHGRELQNGDSIVVQYLIHDGELGNLDSNIETYFVFNNELKNIAGGTVDGNAVLNVTFASSDAVISGSDSESKEQVRQNIGLNTRSLALVSPESYKNFINKFSFCGYNRTWSDKGSLKVNSIIMKNYKLQLSNGTDYFGLKEADFKLTDAQKSSIINALDKSGNQLAGVVYNIMDPELCKYALFLYIKLKSSNYDQEYIRTQIRQLVGEFFANVKSDIYIPKSDIINLITSNVEGVDGVNAYFLSEKNETALQTKEYTKVSKVYNPSTNTYDVKKETVVVHDGDNPNLGLDNHGNIYLENDDQFPVLLGGWDYLNNQGDEVTINDPLVIVFE